MAVHVINEARRCLQCKKPLCRIKGCPVQTNVPEMVRLFLDGKINEAGAMLYDNNPMSVFCSLVCDHDAQCEGNCIQGRRGAPIQIPVLSITFQTPTSTNSSSRESPTTGTTSPSSAQVPQALL